MRGQGGGCQEGVAADEAAGACTGPHVGHFAPCCIPSPRFQCRATAKSPLGSKRRSPASAPAGKENAGLNGSSSSGLTPRTAEPAPPPQAALSAWKQQQLAALSAGFHTRQRRLLELLSACNRVALASPAAGMAAAGAPAQAAPASCGSGSKAAKADGATPALGPRAAAVAAASCWAAAAGSGEGRGARAGMGRALGRLKEQQAA